MFHRRAQLAPDRAKQVYSSFCTVTWYRYGIPSQLSMVPTAAVVLFMQTLSSISSILDMIAQYFNLHGNTTTTVSEHLHLLIKTRDQYIYIW